ncbi:hypothetical protein KIN20_026171 [Parelaphostrongylus tenuis]|uniref:Uncharacterized protein n=1 Tax=Parelaphostrongylus tenuis TaxID=148309 RepID=A0AAD5MWE4_PARTN|nr:hypothetical protein KIN20_026171 [Parelaphostrongylus tenuis]
MCGLCADYELTNTIVEMRLYATEIASKSFTNINTETKLICAKSNVDHFLVPKWAGSLGLVASRSDLATPSIVSNWTVAIKQFHVAAVAKSFSSRQCKAICCQENREHLDHPPYLPDVCLRPISIASDDWGTGWTRRTCVETSIICVEN